MAAPLPNHDLPDYETHDGLALAELVKTRAVKPEELLDAAIARIERGNPTINAMTLPLYDHARAAIKAGLPQGPFTGVPFLPKELGQMLAGTRLANGSKLFADFVPTRNSTLTQRYIDAGFVIAGRTNSPRRADLRPLRPDRASAPLAPPPSAEARVSETRQRKSPLAL